MSDDISFIDAEMQTNSGNKDGITFKEIVLQHVKKIGVFMSVEYRGGYWETKEVKTAVGLSTIENYVPDTREIFSHSVDYLHDILYPYFDEEMLQKSKEANDKLDTAFLDNTIYKQKDREDQNSKQGRIFKTDGDRISYRSEKVRIQRALFRELCRFLHRARYLEGTNFEEAT